MLKTNKQFPIGSGRICTYNGINAAGAKSFAVKSADSERREREREREKVVGRERGYLVSCTTESN